MENGGKNMYLLAFLLVAVVCTAKIVAGHRMFCAPNSLTNQGDDKFLQNGSGANYYHYNYVTAPAEPGNPATIKKCYIRFATNEEVQLAPFGQQTYQKAVSEKKSLLLAPQLSIGTTRGYFILFSQAKEQLRNALFQQQQKTAQDIANLLGGSYKEYAGKGEVLQQAKEFLGPKF